MDGIQGDSFRPSDNDELRTPIQPLNIQRINLIDSVVINEDRIRDIYYKSKADYC